MSWRLVVQKILRRRPTPPVPASALEKLHADDAIREANARYLQMRAEASAIHAQGRKHD